MIDRTAGLPVPHKRCLSLIADPQRLYDIFVYPGIFYQQLYRLYRIPVDLVRVLLHTSFRINDLAMGQIRPADKLCGFVKQKRFGTLRTLVDSKHISCHLTDSPLRSLRFLPRSVRNLSLIHI